MAADIDTVAFVIDGPRDAAQITAFFEDERHHIGACQQLISGGKTGRAGADMTARLREPLNGCIGLSKFDLTVRIIS